jgi:hypothetical protein
MPSPSTNAQLILGVGQRIGTHREGREVVSLPCQDLMHTLCTGKSGFGKSRFLCAFAVMLLSRGIPFILIDPAGDLARLMLAQLVALGYFAQHTDPFANLLYLDIPAAHARQLYLPFNVLRTNHDPYTTADVVLEAFKRAFPALKSGTAVNIETLVKLCSYVLAVHQLPLFPYLYYLLTDAAYRQTLLRSITDDLVVQFFTQHTNQRTGELDVGVESTIKRLFLIAFAPLLRYSLGQTDNVLNFHNVLAAGKSIILNLNVPDPDAMRLLGCLTTVGIELAAKARGQIPASQRTSRTMLFIDEFHNFCAQSGDAMDHVLVECRKVGLFLCLAHQSFTQLSASLKGALNNCDMRVLFRVERADAEEGAPLLGFPIDLSLLKPSTSGTPRSYSTAEQKELHIQAITQLAKREAFIRLPEDRVYKMECLTVDDPIIDPTMLAAIEGEYLRRYFRKQAVVEAEIATYLDNTRSHGVSVLQKAPSGIQFPSAIIGLHPPFAASAYESNNGFHATKDTDEDEDEILRD